MENICDKCNVQLNSYEAYCPLCGRCVNEENIGVTPSYNNFPSGDTFKKRRNNAFKLIIGLLLIGTLLSVLSELIIYKTIDFNYYVITGILFLLIGVIYPIKNNWTLVNYHSIFYFTFSAYILFIETYTGSFGWGLVYVIPLFALGLSLYNFFMVLSNLNTRSEYILPMFILTFISTISLIANYNITSIIWPSLSAFFASVAFTLILMLVRAPKIFKFLKQKFHI